MTSEIASIGCPLVFLCEPCFKSRILEMLDASFPIYIWENQPQDKKQRTVMQGKPLVPVILQA